MKTIALLATCMIAGLPRSPVEGLQTVTDEEAQRLIDAGMAEEAAAEPAVDQGDATEDLQPKTIAELRDIAAAEGVSLKANAREADIIAAIEAKRAQR